MRIVAVLLVFSLLGGCTVAQVSSGSEFLAAKPEYSAASGTDLDQAVMRAANVEPLLRFPARLGLARISGGQFVPVPPREADAWIAFAQSHTQYGEFVPISPLVGELTAAAAGYTKNAWSSPIVPIRLGAARQHVDAVLVYTVGGNSRDKSSPLSLLDLTIIGAYLVPSRSIEGTAMASALLFDVRYGYPYGTMSATSIQTGFVPNVGSNQQSQDLQVDAQVAAVGKLTGEVDKVLIKLCNELQEIKPKALPAQAISPAPLPAVPSKGQGRS